MSETVNRRFWSKVRRVSGGCWLWTGARNRYGLFRLNGKVRKAHRVAWELTNGPIPDGLNVLHTCDNPPCVRPSHLFLGTQAENVRDMWAKGRHGPGPHVRVNYRGSLTPAAKLSETDVLAIRRLSADGWSLRRLAEQFGVGQNAIFKVVHRRSWSHVEDPPVATLAG